MGVEVTEEDRTGQRKKIKEQGREQWRKRSPQMISKVGEASLTWRKKRVSGRERWSIVRCLREVKKEKYTESCRFSSVKRVEA